MSNYHKFFRGSLLLLVGALCVSPSTALRNGQGICSGAELIKVEQAGDHAISYFQGNKGSLWGPQFLQLTDSGWIIDASSVAEFIVYDYSNQFWYAVDGDYPYLALIKKVYDMKRVSLNQRGRAWMIDTSSPNGR